MFSKRNGFTNIILILTLCFTCFGQTKEREIKEVKTLKKSLKKYSRYQIYNRTVLFDPIEFKTCSVKYKFKLVESIGNGTATSSVLSSSTLDSYERSRQTQSAKRDVRSANSTNSVSVVGGDKNDIVVDLSKDENARKSKIVSFDLGAIDLETVRVFKNSKGTFLGFIVNNQNETGVSSEEVFPIAKEKKSEKVKQALLNAIQQCK